MFLHTCCTVRRRALKLECLLLWLCLHLQLPVLVCEELKGNCSLSRTIQDNFYQPGDAILGGNLPLIQSFMHLLNFTHLPNGTHSGSLIKIKHYQHFLSLLFAIHEINYNQRILNNVTLGIHVYDNLFGPKTTYETLLDLLSAQKKNIPNYSCDKKMVWSVIGGLTIQNSIQMADILSNYKMPQLIYGSSEATISDNPNLPFLYWMGPQETNYHIGLVQLLLHFKWIWVGLLVSDDDMGEKFVQRIIHLFTQSSICLAFLQRNSASYYDSVNLPFESILKSMRTVFSSDVNVIIVNMDSHLIIIIMLFLEEKVPHVNSYFGKVWIMPPHWYLSISPNGDLFGNNFLHGALSFSAHTYVVPKFWEFLYDIKSNFALMHFVCLFWLSALKLCKHCREEKLEELFSYVFDIDMSAESYSIYNAAYAASYALHDIYVSREKMLPGKRKLDHSGIHPWQLNSWMKNIHFNNGAGQEVVLENRGFLIGYDIMNWVTFPNQTFLKNKVGEISPSQIFSITEEAIVWHRTLKQMPPPSKCVESCPLGYSKIIQKGKPICCYSCVPCSENMISRQTDAALCAECPEDQYPNENKDQCIPKIISFLSYQEPLGIISTVSIISFSVVTCFVMQTFRKNWDTPIVKANNQSLTCILLLSILLCYLAALLFIGKPGKVTCLLQQPMFVISFSVAISCVLAKTIIVILAFMSAKPASQMRKRLGRKLGNTVVFASSFLQVCICVAWLSTSPPFPGADMHSQTGEILLQCKEGSHAMFHCALGYLGFLSSISFIVAFLARKLPSAFNEAKFITFSMLVFCSVWLSFIPTYLSTKGKSIVAVEVFAILASNTGLLACIFLPKCYIVIFRADLNSRKQLKGKGKHST